MNKAKIFLNICIGIGIVICSITLLIFSSKNAPTTAQTTKDGFVLAGVTYGETRSGHYYIVFAYDPKTGAMKELSRVDAAVLK